MSEEGVRSTVRAEYTPTSQLNLPAQQILASGQVTLNTADVLTTQGQITGTDIILHGDNGLNLGHDIAASGFLNLEAPSIYGSGVQQTTGLTISVAGHTTVTAGGGPITLTGIGNDFNSISASTTGSDIAIRDVNHIVLGET